MPTTLKCPRCNEQFKSFKPEEVEKCPYCGKELKTKIVFDT